MLRLMVYSAVVLAHVATGAPSARTGAAATTVSPPQHQLPAANQIKPAVAETLAEEELESLKHIGHSGESHITNKNNNASSATETEAVPAKLPANEEHPAPSDNDNDNLDKLFGRPLSIRSAAAFPFELEEAALKAKAADLHSFRTGSDDPVMTPNTDEDILGKKYQMGELDVTAKDMAEYIFLTGDEYGVAASLQEYLDEGLISKEQMLLFLNELQGELDVFRSLYGEEEKNLEYGTAWKSRYYDADRTKPGQYTVYKGGIKRSAMQMDVDTAALFPIDYTSVPDVRDDGDQVRGDVVMNGGELVWKSEMNRLAQMEDAQLREDTLQDVVYSIAKQLFYEELQKKPQRSIQKMASFSQELELGAALPADLNRAVHESLTRALVDAVADVAKNWARDQIVSKELELAAGTAIPLTKSQITSAERAKAGHHGSLAGANLRSM